jgi:quercetin dioxygenase-like cupin family protein
MDIKRSGSRPSGKGPDTYFTGSVRIDPLSDPPEPARVSMALVTFEPGARTAWHTHPFGQTLIVTAGSGWVQRQGGEKVDIHPGDVVYFLPGEKHWHGATALTGMSHIAVQEKLNGSPVEWMEQVTEEEYEWSRPCCKGKDLNSLQMTCRAIVSFFLTLVLIRIAGIRTFGKKTPFDNVVAIMLGSIFSRVVEWETAWPEYAEGADQWKGSLGKRAAADQCGRIG